MILALLSLLAAADAVLLLSVNFANYNGSGLHPTAQNGALNSSQWRAFVEPGQLSTYGATNLALNTDFSRGLFTPGSTAGGIGAANVNTTTRAMYLLPSTTAFTPGFVELRSRYDNPPATNAVLDVTLEIEFWSLNTGTSSSSNWTVGFYSGDMHDVDVKGTDDKHYTTPSSSTASSTWVRSVTEFNFTTQYTAGDDYLFIRISGDDVAGSMGVRDVLAIAHITMLVDVLSTGATTTTGAGQTTTTGASQTTTTGAGQSPTTGAGQSTDGGQTTVAGQTAVVGDTPAPGATSTTAPAPGASTTAAASADATGTSVATSTMLSLVALSAAAVSQF